MYFRQWLGFVCALSVFFCQAQKRIAITIDDVPNVHLSKPGEPSLLLSRLDSLHIPIAIFINERNLTFSPDTVQNKALLEGWIRRDYVTAGNHSYSHPAYSKVGLDSFSRDVIRGEALSHNLVRRENKELRYFRFPYNDLGEDSVAHRSINNFLAEHGYISTPFTLEGEDWMFATLYEHYLSSGNKQEASRVAHAYVRHTIELLAYLESIANERYHRPINQIYLCHDNRLNADYLPGLIRLLHANGYSFIRLSEAMEDTVYQLQDYYTGKAGFSWLYRWVKDPDERKKLMKGEPDNAVFEKQYELLTK